MRQFLFAVLLAGASFSTVVAQTTPPPAPAPDPAPTVAAPTTPATAAKPSKDEIKAARMACVDDAKGKSLKGPARHDAVKACMAQKYPQVAKMQDCRKQGKDKGLVKKEMKAFMQQCTAG